MEGFLDHYVMPYVPYVLYVPYVIGAVSAYVVGWTAAGYGTSGMGATAASLYGPVIAGAAGGATASFITGGNILAGALTGGAFGYIGYYTDRGLIDRFAATMAHGVVGGFGNVLQGQEFGAGFWSAFAGKGMTVYGAGFMNGPVSGLIRASVVGGVASDLGGGKFKNGAETAAMGYLFNDGWKKNDLDRSALEAKMSALAKRYLKILHFMSNKQWAFFYESDLLKNSDFNDGMKFRDALNNFNKLVNEHSGMIVRYRNLQEMSLQMIGMKSVSDTFINTYIYFGNKLLTTKPTLIDSFKSLLGIGVDSIVATEEANAAHISIQCDMDSCQYVSY